MEILICTATSIEANACQRGLKFISGSQFRVLKTGIGMAEASNSLTRYLQEGHNPDLIVSSGFAGAVTDDLLCYSWIAAEKIFSADGQILNPYLIKGLPGVRRASVITWPHLFSPERRSQLPPSLPDRCLAVDMETSALASVASLFRVPFLTFRLITDTPAEPLPQLLYQITEHQAQNRGRLRLAGHLLGDILGHIPQAVDIYRRMKISAELFCDGWERNAFQVASLGEKFSQGSYRA